MLQIEVKVNNMSYVACDTTPRYTPIEYIVDEELHFLIDSEVQRVPFIYGVFILYDAIGPVHVGCGTLISELLLARAQHSEATRFSLKFGCTDVPTADQLAKLLKKEFGLTDIATNKEQIGFRK
jgi:hypothetical protein